MRCAVDVVVTTQTHAHTSRTHHLYLYTFRCSSVWRIRQMLISAPGVVRWHYKMRLVVRSAAPLCNRKCQRSQCGGHRSPCICCGVGVRMCVFRTESGTLGWLITHDRTHVENSQAFGVSVFVVVRRQNAYTPHKSSNDQCAAVAQSSVCVCVCVWRRAHAHAMPTLTIRVSINCVKLANLETHYTIYFTW